MSRRFAVLLCLLVGWLSACVAAPTVTAVPTATISSAPASPSPTPIVIENEGEVCFHGYDAAASKLQGTFRPKGCFSSSCTRALEQTVDVTLDRSRSEIRFHTRFVLVDTTVRTPEARSCTADCMGGGQIPFEIGDVSGQRYAVLLGDHSIGELQVTTSLSMTNVTCFGESD